MSTMRIVRALAAVVAAVALTLVVAGCTDFRTGYFCYQPNCAVGSEQVLVTPDAKVHVGSTGNSSVGCYVDDTNRDQWAALAACPSGQVKLWGVAPNRSLPQMPPASYGGSDGVLRLREWYPDPDFGVLTQLPPTDGEGWILPATFHWTAAEWGEDEQPYNMLQRQKMYCWIKQNAPHNGVVWYGWDEWLGPRIQAMMQQTCPTFRVGDSDASAPDAYTPPRPPARPGGSTPGTGPGG